MTKHTPYGPGDLIRSGNTNDDIDGLATGENDVDNNSLSLFRREMFEDAFLRGTMKWSKISGLVGSMTLGTYYLRGVRFPASGISSRTFANNSDNYIYFDEAGQIIVQSVQNGAESPTKPTDRILNAIIITTAGQIVNIIQTGLDSKSNYIYNTGLIGKATSAYDLGFPIGSCLMWPGALATMPAGFLVRDGAAVSRTQYAALFKVIGSTYGAGNGTTTFNLPDDRARVDVGLDARFVEYNAIGKQGGETYHTLSWEEMPRHTHGVYDPGHRHYSIEGANPVYVVGGSTLGLAGGPYERITYGPAVTTASLTYVGIYESGASYAHNNLQPYSIKLPIIKAF